MAQSVTTTEGTLIIPGSYASWQVVANNSGLSTSGVVLLLGEADAGPDYSLESSLQDNAFGPDDEASVASKYRSGNIVDAFRAAASPANDPNITGSPSSIIIVKTNSSTKASADLLNYASASYGYLADKSYGTLGNMTNYQVIANVSEVVPTTGAFTWISNVAEQKIQFRVNGGAAVALTVAANQTPAQIQASIAALYGSGVTATGGGPRTAITVAGTIGLAASGNTAVITISGTFSTGQQPVMGDTLLIHAGSVIAGASSPGHNIGAYVVTSATTSVINVTKLSNNDRAAAVPNTVTAPETVAPVSVGAGTDINVYAPIVISAYTTTPTVLDGVGKSLEIAEVSDASTDLITYSCFALGTTGVSWISRTGAAYALTSATEYVAEVDCNRSADNIQEQLVAGGEIAMKLGYLGDTASMVINAAKTTAVITITGGTGTYGLGGVTLTLSDFPTLGDLANFLNSKTGYVCDLGTAVLGQLPPSALDSGTYAFASKWGAETARIKIDAYRFFNEISQTSALVQFQNAAGNTGVIKAASSGLPVPTAVYSGQTLVSGGYSYLANGAKGGTTAAQIVAAIDKCERLRANFLVPLFSRDATADILDSLTDASSTYQIDAINAYLRSHVLKMSTLKQRRNRQGFASKKDTFANARTAAANIASFRVPCCFQDCKTVGSDGLIHQYQPWMNSVIAAGMQAAGFYRAIVEKYANISGAVQAAGDYDDQSISNTESALISGLLPLTRAETGGWKWVSDQTTYGKDNNFVFNSIQAVYVADLIAMTTASRMEKAFAGQSVADVSAPLAKAFLEAVMSDFLKLKLIAASDDAPKGFKNATIRISGTSMIVSFEVKLAGAIYFIPINFLVSQVQQSA